MFNRKKLTNLSKDDLVELIKRTELINGNILIAQALELQKRVWLQGCFQRLGLSLEKKYNINYKDGAITEEIKDEPKGNQKSS